MNYRFKLEGLNCANCANKIEKDINEHLDIDEATLNFTNSILIVDSKKESGIDILVKEVVAKYEPDVDVIEENKKNSKITPKSLRTMQGHLDNKSINKLTKSVVDTYKFDLKISNLDCASCANKVESAIKKLAFVQNATINFSTNKLIVVTNTNLSENELITKIQNLVYKLEDNVVISSNKPNKLNEVKKDNILTRHGMFIVGVILLIGGVLIGEDNALILFVLSYTAIGGKVVLKALRNIKNGDIFDENFLMSIATLGAFCIGEYTEAIAVMLLYYIGELFQGYAVNKSRKSITSLMDITVDSVNVFKNGNEYKTNIENVRIGDVVVVRPGERVGLDGKVVEGETSLDTSALTGESMPRKVKLNDEILAGVINLTGLIKIKVSTISSESTISRIIDLVENATNKKAPIERFITKFARVYTPIVCFLALIVATVFPLLLNQSFNVWIYRALTFLVVSCPCALVISVPLALFAGIGGASKQGVLIKGGHDLERLKDIDVVVVDKTGTLTKGVFSVVEVVGEDHDKIIEIAAYGEYYSKHPIANSITSYYPGIVDIKKITNFKEHGGRGISVDIEGIKTFIGNGEFMKENGYNPNNNTAIGTIVHVASNNMYLGHLVIADKIKETTKKGIQELYKFGVKDVVMLTGDDEIVASVVAKELGITKYYSNLLPQDKVKIVEELLEKPHKQLAFVGDGINDAPVLARSDIGIAMGGIGSDVAIEAADVVLMNDDIVTISLAIKASIKTNKILKQNIIFSLGIKIFVLLLVTLGIADMWLGVLADVGVTILAIVNSMRALK